MTQAPKLPSPEWFPLWRGRIINAVSYQGGSAYAKREYNYLVFRLENGLSIKDTIRLDQLNKAGEEGWELISVNPLGSSFLMYTFKRPVEAGVNRPAAQRTAPTRNEKPAQKPRGASPLDIKVAQPKPQPEPQPEFQQGFDLQDILNSILGGKNLP